MAAILTMCSWWCRYEGNHTITIQRTADTIYFLLASLSVTKDVNVKAAEAFFFIHLYWKILRDWILNLITDLITTYLLPLTYLLLLAYSFKSKMKERYRRLDSIQYPPANSQRNRSNKEVVDIDL
jgi:hypothetical protein